MIRKSLKNLLKITKFNFARKIRVLSKPLDIDKIILEKNINSKEKFFPEMIKTLDFEEFKSFYEKNKNDFSEISLIYSFEKINSFIKLNNSQENIDSEKKNYFEKIFLEIETNLKNEMKNFEKEEINRLLDVYSQYEIYDKEFLDFLNKKKNFIFSDCQNYLFILSNLDKENLFFKFILKKLEDEFYLNNFEKLNSPKLVIKIFELYLIKLENLKNSFEIEKKIKMVFRNMNFDQKILLFKIYSENLIKIADLEILDEIAYEISEECKFLELEKIIGIFSYINNLKYENENLISVLAKYFLIKFKEEINIFEDLESTEDFEKFEEVKNFVNLEKLDLTVKVNKDQGSEFNPDLFKNLNFLLEANNEKTVEGKTENNLENNDDLLEKNKENLSIKENKENFQEKNHKNLSKKENSKSSSIKIKEEENLLKKENEENLLKRENEENLSKNKNREISKENFPETKKNKNLQTKNSKNPLQLKKEKLYNDCAYILYTLLKLDFISDIHYSEFISILTSEIILLNSKSLNYLIFSHSKFSFDKYSHYMNNKKKYLRRSLKKILYFKKKI